MLMVADTGYGRFGGPRATATELTSIFQLMEQNALLQPERLLTGILFFFTFLYKTN